MICEPCQPFSVIDLHLAGIVPVNLKKSLGHGGGDPEGEGPSRQEGFMEHPLQPLGGELSLPSHLLWRGASSGERGKGESCPSEKH